MGLHQCFPTAALGNTKASSGFVKCYPKVSNSSSKRKTKNEKRNSQKFDLFCIQFNSEVKKWLLDNFFWHYWKAIPRACIVYLLSSYEHMNKIKINNKKAITSLSAMFLYMLKCTVYLSFTYKSFVRYNV